MALLQVGLQLGLGPAELKLLFPDRESLKNWHSKFSAIPAAENRPDSGATAETPSEGGGRTEAQSGALVRLRPCEARSRSLGWGSVTDASDPQPADYGRSVNG